MEQQLNTFFFPAIDYKIYTSKNYSMEVLHTMLILLVLCLFFFKQNGLNMIWRINFDGIDIGSLPNQMLRE